MESECRVSVEHAAASAAMNCSWWRVYSAASRREAKGRDVIDATPAGAPCFSFTSRLWGKLLVRPRLVTTNAHTLGTCRSKAQPALAPRQVKKHPCSPGIYSLTPVAAALRELEGLLQELERNLETLKLSLQGAS